MRSPSSAVTLVAALPGLVEVGLVRLLVGDEEGAEEASTRAEELGASTLPGCAQLALARGDAQSAHEELSEALEAALPDLRRAAPAPARASVR